MIEADPDYGYPIIEGRRKVLLWSKEAWRDVDRSGHPSLPTGRFVSGVTRTPLGDVQIIGVCIPWSGAHVSTGRRDRRRWQDHLAYLSALSAVIPRRIERLIVIGDYNQKVPRTHAPVAAYSLLREAILNRLTVATGGKIEPLGEAIIDHVAHSPDLTAHSVWGLSKLVDEGPLLSDHNGVCVTLVRTGGPTESA